MAAKEESCSNVWHSVFGEDKQTKESQNYNKATSAVLFRQKGKCRIIWYCPIAVKGEVCGNYWTVLDSSPPVFPLLLKIQPSWCDEETWPDQQKDKDNVFSLFLKILMMTIDQVMIPCPYRFWSAIYYWLNFMFMTLFIHFVCLTWILNDPNSNYSS